LFIWKVIFTSHFDTGAIVPVLEEPLPSALHLWDLTWFFVVKLRPILR